MDYIKYYILTPLWTQFSVSHYLTTDLVSLRTPIILVPPVHWPYNLFLFVCFSSQDTLSGCLKYHGAFLIILAHSFDSLPPLISLYSLIKQKPWLIFICSSCIPTLAHGWRKIYQHKDYSHFNERESQVELFARRQQDYLLLILCSTVLDNYFIPPQTPVPSYHFFFKLTPNKFSLLYSTNTDCLVHLYISKAIV